MRLHDRLQNTLAGLVVAGTPRDTAPACVPQLAREWAAFFARALDMAELDLAILQGRTKLQPRRIGSGGRVAAGVANARRRRICTSPDYQGRPDAFVAYVEGCSVDLVRRTREARRRDARGLSVTRSQPPASPRSAVTGA